MEENKDEYHTIQIINIKIDTEKFLEGDFYCFNKQNEIKRKVDPRANKVLVNFIFSGPINEAWAVDTLMDYQRLVTDIIIVPPTDINMDEFENWKTTRNPTQVLKSI